MSCAAETINQVAAYPAQTGPQSDGQVTSLTNRRVDDGIVTVSAGSSTRKRHLGVEFVIWKRESAWFWLLTQPRGERGIIGATTNQVRATREARWAIEAILQSREPEPGNDNGLVTAEEQNAMGEDDEL